MCLRVRRRYYNEEKRRLCAVPVSMHPLLPNDVTQAQLLKNDAQRTNPVKVSVTDRDSKAKYKLEAISVAHNPLSATNCDSESLNNSATDLLNVSARQSKCDRSASAAVASEAGNSNSNDSYFDPWHVRKTQILSKFTTGDQLSIVACVVSQPNAVEQSSLRLQKWNSVENKVRQRLELLDERDQSPLRAMSQAEIVNRIDEMSRALQSAWQTDQRVRALNIAIQCAKLLGSTDIMAFYPSKFVLVTDVLDHFSKLVCQRLKQKISATVRDGSCDFDSSAISRETARNWFLKVAVVRDLIPRFYLETALARAVHFLDATATAPVLVRLARIARGFGDPLVAAYGRLYVARCAIDCSVGTATSTHMDCFRLLFVDQLDSLQRLAANAQLLNSTLASKRFTFSKYIGTFQPVLDFIVYCVATHYQSPTTQGKLAQCDAFAFIIGELRERYATGSLVQALIVGFSPATIAVHADVLVDLIALVSQMDFSQPALLRQLGKCLARASRADLQCLTSCIPTNSDDRTRLFKIAILDEVYHRLCSYQVDDYVQNFEVWLELFLQYAQSETQEGAVSVLLDDLIKHLAVESTDWHSGLLLSVLRKSLAHCAELEVLFVSSVFDRFLSLIKQEAAKLDAFKACLEAFFERRFARVAGWDYASSPTFVSDPLLVASLLNYAKALHDSVTVITLSDDQRSIARLVCAVIDTVRFDDIEQQLQFFVDCRAAFHQLESVQIALIHSVVNLSMHVHRVCLERAFTSTLAVNPDFGKGSNKSRSSKFLRGPGRKVQSFQHACTAFCFVTVPILASISQRLRLYLLVCQTALLAGCSAQAEACLEAFLLILSDATDCDLLSDPAFGPISAMGHTIEQLAIVQNTLLDLVRVFMSTVLYVPDNPCQKSHLGLLRKLLTAVQCAANGDSKARGVVLSDALRCEVYANALELLLAYAQPKYMQHPRVIGLQISELSGSLVSENLALLSVSSNDVLYCNDEAFQLSVNKLIRIVFNQLMLIIQAQPDSTDSGQQHSKWANLTGKLFQILLCRFDFAVQPDAVTLDGSVQSLLMNVTQLLSSFQISRVTRVCFASLCERVLLKHYSNDSSLANFLRPLATQLNTID